MVRVIGAGLPRTGTKSLELLLGEPCYHMTEVFQHPEHVDVWRGALRGETPDWDAFLSGYAAAVDWPASIFWRELAEAYPDAVIVLSTRENAAQWWSSCDATILRAAREDRPVQDRNWLAMFHEQLERELGENWRNPATAQAGYERHNAAVRAQAPADRLVELPAGAGWEPLCTALGVPVPDEPYPHTNSRAEWTS
jgi:Sulfotransferase domain